MKECFCGCGREIPRFPLGMRSLNKRGALASERLSWAEAVLGDEPPDDWVEEGEEILGVLRCAMHGELDPRSVNEEWVSRWQAWGQKMETAVVLHGGPAINDWLQAQQP